MIVAIIFLCGITQIMGRPNSNGSSKLNSVDNLQAVPSWPQLNNTYLVPKKLEVDDTINITAIIENTPVFNISLIAENRISTDYSKVLCTLIADTLNEIVKILDDKGNPLENVDADIADFFLNDDKTIFNVWFRRRRSEMTQNNNILEVRSNSFTSLLHLHEVNDIRFLKFTGDNVKVTELEFKYYSANK